MNLKGKPMIEHSVEIPTEDGVMSAFTFQPDNRGPYPAVILYMDASGIREELKEMSRHIAAKGYFCLLPDLYYRLGLIRFDPERRDENRDEAMRKVVSAARFSIDNERTMRDTKGMLSWLDKNEAVKAGAKGCIGYCMSGQFIVSAAGTFPEHFAAGAALYGLLIVTDKPDSPHLLANRIKGELYLGFAETDPQVPSNVFPDLTAELDKYGISYRLDVYPGTHHGFCFPERSVYKKDAAEQVWEIVFDLFERRLNS